jgi:uncharacterized SAM-binding protein YcdF (DUF218 family)
MFITLKTVLHTVLLPPALPLLLAAAGAWLVGRASAAAARRAGWVLLLMGVGGLWLLSTPLVADTLSRSVQRCPPLDLTRPVEAQAVVILGGEAERPGAPEYGGEPAVERSLLERLDYGALVARRTGLPVLVSGTASETLAMRAALARDFNVPTRWVEDHSRDTFQNAQFSARLLRPAGVTRIILVTDADHEWRALHEFASAGFSVVPAPVGLYTPRKISLHSFVPTASALARSTDALHEFLGDVVREALAALHLRRQTP